MRPDGGSELLELIENDLAVNKFLEDSFLGLLELAFEFRAAARELGRELRVDGGEHERDFIGSDDAPVDLRGDPVDLDRALL